MRDRLVELIGSKVCEGYSPTCDEYDPHTCSNCYANNCKIGSLADHLFVNGVIVPPCKVEDTVYQVDTLFDEIIITELTVIELTIDSKGIRTLYGMTNQGSVYCFNRGYNLNDIKFTKEEAEQALKGGVRE